MPPSPVEWLPENHLARFIIEVIHQLDLTKLTRKYAGRGSATHHSSVLLGLLVYGYATEVFSSHKIDRASYDSVALRYIAANTHPDHYNLAHFCKTNLAELEELFVQVLQVAQPMKLVKFGTIALGGGSTSPVKRFTCYLVERLRPDAPPPETEDPLVKMAAKLKTWEGRKCYGLRKCTVEVAGTVFKCDDVSCFDNHPAIFKNGTFTVLTPRYPFSGTYPYQIPLHRLSSLSIKPYLSPSNLNFL